MNDFFDETTSNYSEQQESQDNNNDAKQNDTKKKETPIKKTIKPTKSYNSYNVAQEFLYHPDLEQLDLQNFISQNVVIYVERKFFSKRNKNILRNKIYGNDFYTSSSDIVCVFLHYWMKLEEIKKKKFEVLGIIFSVSKVKKNYASMDRNGIRSRRFTNQNNTKNFNLQNIKPAVFKTFQKLKFEKYYQLAQNLKLSNKKIPYEISKRIPRTNQLQFGQMVFNSNQELAFKYDIMNICDKSQKSKDYLSYLTSQYYLVLETIANQKFFLSISKKENLKILGNEFYYKICKVKNPIEFDNSFFNNENINFDQALETLYDELLWTDIQWSNTKITFKDMSIEHISNFKFYPNNNTQENMHNRFFNNETLLKIKKKSNHLINQRELRRQQIQNYHQIIYHHDTLTQKNFKIEYIIILLALTFQSILSYMSGSYLSQINFFFNFFLSMNYLFFFGLHYFIDNRQSNIKLILILCNYLFLFYIMGRTTLKFLIHKNNIQLSVQKIFISTLLALISSIILDYKLKKFSKNEPIERIPLMTLFRQQLCILDDNLMYLQYYLNFICIFSGTVIYYNQHLKIMDIFLFFSCTLLIIQMVLPYFIRLVQIITLKNPIELDLQQLQRQFLFIRNAIRINEFRFWLNTEFDCCCYVAIIIHEDDSQNIKFKYQIQNFSFTIYKQLQLIFNQIWLQIYITLYKQFLKLFFIQCLFI